MSRMHTFFHGSDTPYGIFYPTNYLVAIFPGFSEASEAQRILRKANFANDDVLAAPGKDVVLHAAEDLHKMGLWGLLMTELSRLLGTEAVYADQDLAMAQQGSAFLAVFAPTEASKLEAWAAIEPLKPLVARHYARYSIEVFRGVKADHTQPVVGVSE